MTYCRIAHIQTCTHTHTHTTSTHTPSILAFSSQDKSSWCLACWDLIGKAYFTFPKPGLIYLGAPADRNLLLSAQFPHFCFPFLFILGKKMNKNCAEGVQGKGQRKGFFSFHFFFFRFPFQGAVFNWIRKKTLRLSNISLTYALALEEKIQANLTNQTMLYLQSGGIPRLIHPPHQSNSLLFLLHLGLSDVPGPVWNGADSNKHSLPESYGRVTMLSFKEKYSRFYLHSPFCLDDVVCSGTRS